MSKGNDIVALLEWAERQRTFKQPKAKGFRKAKVDKDINLIDVYINAQSKVARDKKFLEDLEKLMKKEEKAEKKDPSRTLSFLEWYVIGALSYPFLGPLYHMVVK